jgi:hypothetical protein
MNFFSDKLKRGLPVSSSDSITAKEHLLALRKADQALYEERDKRYEERDRRYAEVNQARAEAVKVKEAAQSEALELARREQEYKDKKASELRDQFGAASGSYVTKDELIRVENNIKEEFKSAIDPIVEYIASQRGKSEGASTSFGVVVKIVAVAGTLITILNIIIIGVLRIAKVI